MSASPTFVRWVSCSLEMGTQVAKERHLVVPGHLTTLCGHSASHADIWRGNSAKPECETCRKHLGPDYQVIQTRAPYGSKGSGHSGSATSRERQEREDGNGTTAWRQMKVIEHLHKAGGKGLTCGELEREMGAGHGAVSAALSVLHRDGLIARIAERRNRQEVYLMPGYARGRELSPFRPRFNVNRLGEAEVGMLEDAVREAFNEEMGKRTGASAATVAVRAVLDGIRAMTP